MARGTRGPANDPLSSLQQQIHKLEDRVREVETKRILTSQIPNDIDNIDDPVEGEHVIDYKDYRHAWYVDGAWRKAGANQDPVGIVIGKEFNGDVAQVGGDYDSAQYTSWADEGGFPNPASGFGTNDRLASDPLDSPFGAEISTTEDDYYPFDGQTYYVDWSGAYDNVGVRIKVPGIYLASFRFAFLLDDIESDFECRVQAVAGGNSAGGGGAGFGEIFHHYVGPAEGVASTAISLTTVVHISPLMLSPAPQYTITGRYFAKCFAGSWDGFAASYSLWKVGDWVGH